MGPNVWYLVVNEAKSGTQGKVWYLVVNKAKVWYLVVNKAKSATL